MSQQTISFPNKLQVLVFSGCLGLSLTHHRFTPLFLIVSIFLETLLYISIQLSLPDYDDVVLGVRSETSGESTVRSNLVGNAGSRPISEAKQPWACPVLGWGTTGEAHVLYSFDHHFIFIDDPHSEVRAFLRFPHCAKYCLQAQPPRNSSLDSSTFSYSPLDPFTSPRRLFSSPFRAGSGLPCLWVRFPHSPCCTRSSPLSLHPPISSSHVISTSGYLSRSRSTSQSISILSIIFSLLCAQATLAFPSSISASLLHTLISPSHACVFRTIGPISPPSLSEAHARSLSLRGLLVRSLSPCPPSFLYYLFLGWVLSLWLSLSLFRPRLGVFSLALALLIHKKQLQPSFARSLSSFLSLTLTCFGWQSLSLSRALSAYSVGSISSQPPSFTHSP